MGRFIQPIAARGSLKWIQRSVNQHRAILDAALHAAGVKGQIQWLSPLYEDDRAEYRDGEFLRRLGLGECEGALREFWPSRGPQWDALARTDREEVLLVEAKAHVGEICSPGTQAGPNSAARIEKALLETAASLGAASKAAWKDTFYQLANRLAHLRFLRQQSVDARLVLVNFIGDSDIGGPISAREWMAAYQIVEHVMGLRARHALSPFVIHIYPDVAELAG
jgi:hypothetical protein